MLEAGQPKHCVTPGLLRSTKLSLRVRLKKPGMIPSNVGVHDNPEIKHSTYS